MRIVLVTACWPPRNAIGTFRPYSWARHWSESGMEVTVLTSKKYAFDQPLDLVLPVLKGVEVVEVPYIGASNWKHKLASSSLGGLLRKAYRRLKSAGIKVQNPRDGWAKASTKIAKDLALRADVVVSTFTPEGSHVLASVMKRANPKLKWIADYRDLWSLDHITRRADLEQKALTAREINTMRGADFVTTVSEDLLNKQCALLGVPGMVVMNGYDDDFEVVKARLIQKEIHKKKLLTLVYTGRIYPKTRDPRPLLDCLVHMKSRGLLQDCMVELHVYGDQVEYFKQLANQKDYASFLRLKGYVSNAEARLIQQEADALLLLESPDVSAKGVVTGKLFEYMASGSPVLSLGSKKGYAIGQIIESTGIGIVAEDRQEVIERFIAALVVGENPIGASKSWQEIERCSRRHQAEQMLDKIKELYAEA